MAATLPRAESDPVALDQLTAETAEREAADAVLEAADVALAVDVAAADAAAAGAAAIANAALPKAGGTLTGPLLLAGDPVGNLEAATRQFVAAQVAALIAGAPGALDTLKELADRLVTDESAVEALAGTLAGKLGAAANLADLVDAVAARGNLGLGTAAVQPAGAFDPAGAAGAAQAASQPLDADLTAIAAIATSAFGRGLLGSANAAALRASAEAAAAVHAASHQLGGADALVLPQYDPYDQLPYVIPMGFTPGTTQAPVAKRAYFMRFTVARKRTFKFVRWPVGVVGTGAEDKVDAAIYRVNGAKLERLGSSGAVKTNMTAVGAKANELTGAVVCEPGIVYMVAVSQEVVTGTPQVLALLNNNGSVGDMVGTGTLANRLMLIKNETFPLPEEVTVFTQSAPVTYMLPSEV